MLLLIDNFDSFTWNLVHYLGELGAACEVVRNDSLTPAEALARNPGSRTQIRSFTWRGSHPFRWNSHQLMELGLMEPGQWF